MIKVSKKSKIILVLALFSAWYIYDEIFNWGEWGQTANYFILALPVGTTLLILSIKASKTGNKYDEVIALIGGILAAIILIPPYIIYRLFIK